jgi:hypothetical protein
MSDPKNRRRNAPSTFPPSRGITEHPASDEPKPVIDEKPATWPAERYERAKKALDAVAFMHLIRHDLRDRDVIVKRWLHGSPLLADVVAVADFEAGSIRSQPGHASRKDDGRRERDRKDLST